MRDSIVRAKSRKHFQVRDIRRSYRIRGSVPRIHKNMKEISRVFIDIVMSAIRGSWVGIEEKNRAVNRLITMMLAYSAINRRAKVPLLYSVLNPETSSDSPSAKSNGVRFVSARVVVNQHIKSKGNSIRGQEFMVFIICVMVRVKKIKMGLRRMRVILTS